MSLMADCLERRALLKRSWIAVVVLGALGMSPSVLALPAPPQVFHIPPRIDKENLKENEDEDRQWFFEIFPEYRARLIRIDPMELNGTNVTTTFWGEQRLRVDTSIGYRGIGAVHLQVDALDGVLFGDNGRFGHSPSPSTGVGIASRQANSAGWRVGLMPGADPLQIDSYGPVLRDIDPVRINYAYGEVLLPVGILRIGRQPASDLGGISLNDGRSGRNLWGVSSYHESVDRLLFGTKISELYRIIAEGDDYVPDLAMDDGVFLGVVYDFLVMNDIADLKDDLQGVAVQLDFRSKKGLFGDLWGETRFTLTGTYRWDERYHTSLVALPFRLNFDVGDFSFAGEYTYIHGSTREISEGFAALTNSLVTDQALRMSSARLIADYKLDDFTFRLEWGYADGDEDPRTTTPLTTASWARDTNLGLLLFKHTLALQTARSAAVGIENLRQLDVESFPLTEVSTEGRVTNVNAIFPQVFWDPMPELRLKAGALFAWAARPVVDPIQTLLRWKGVDIADDAINFNGGKPGKYWGTEIDLGLEWYFKEMFDVVVEAAVLLPGSGFKDENGDAVPSWLFETRFVFHP